MVSDTKCDDAPQTVPATIDDPAMLTEIAEKLQALGYAKSYQPS